MSYRTEETDQNFSAVERQVARKLEAEEYCVIKGEAQEWGARYSLAGKNLDGSVALFFGPIQIYGEGSWGLPYKIIWESTAKGTLLLPRNVDVDGAASIFVNHLVKLLHGCLQPRIENHSNIGVGLVSISVAAAQLDTIRRREASEESAR